MSRHPHPIRRVLGPDGRRHARHSLAWLSLVALLGLAACGGRDAGADAGSGAGSGELDGEWFLESGTRGGTPLTLVPTAPVTLTIEGTEVSGRSACNSYSGALDIGEDGVSFSGLGGTEMACQPAEVMELEAAYLAALSSVETARLEDERLLLTGPDADLSFTQAPPAPSYPLIGTRWRLEGLVDGEQVSSVAPEPGFVQLQANGTLSGFTGCRIVRGGWRGDETALELGAVSMDRRACLPRLIAQDDHVLRVLRGELAVLLDGDTLTLTAQSGLGLVFRAD